MLEVHANRFFDAASSANQVILPWDFHPIRFFNVGSSTNQVSRAWEFSHFGFSRVVIEEIRYFLALAFTELGLPKVRNPNPWIRWYNNIEIAVPMKNTIAIKIFDLFVCNYFTSRCDRCINRKWIVFAMFWPIGQHWFNFGKNLFLSV